MKELIVGSEMTLKNANDKKKTLIHRIFSKRDSHGQGDGSMNKHPIDSFGTEGQTNRVRKSSFSCCAESPTMPNAVSINPFRVFAATWNVGGITPHGDLNLDDFLQVHDESDIYVLGFQEIVPLNAGNVLVIEDNEPAARWLALINQSLNRSSNVNILQPLSTSFSESHSVRSSKSTVTVAATNSGSIFYKKSSLRKISKKYRTEEKRKLKMCNCATELEKKNIRDSCFGCQDVHISEDEFSSEEDDGPSSLVSEISVLSSKENQMKYSLVASKQMVGIFVTIWMKRELVQHVGHLRTSCISRGIMGCLGNKGCISVSLSFHQTSFCFVCSHLASGEREGDELRRNSDVIEILRSTQFPKRCRMPNSRMPDKILDHDRVIWFGDLNYRISLSYIDTRKLLEQNNWDALLAKDQLKMEREAGRVFKGWKEGRIYFPPTYKYSYNSDIYEGETISSKNKRRTPAWCDRILWHGNGIHQLSYIRGENRFSDHRPVWAKFLIDIWVAVGGSPKKGLLSTNMKVGAEELLPLTITPLDSVSNRCLQG